MGAESLANQWRWERRFEKCWPWGIGIVVGLASWHWNISGRIQADALPEFLGALITFAAIMAGFLATIKTILLTASGAVNYERFRQTGMFARLMDFIWWAILDQGVVAVACLAMFFLYSWVSPAHLLLLLSALVGLSALAVSRCYQAARIVKNIVAEMQKS